MESENSSGEYSFTILAVQNNGAGRIITIDLDKQVIPVHRHGEYHPVSQLRLSYDDVSRIVIGPIDEELEKDETYRYSPEKLKEILSQKRRVNPNKLERAA